MSEIPVNLDVAIPVLVLAVLASYLIGRRMGTGPARLRELQSTLDAALAEREELRQETDQYKQRVAEHFTETSHRLHELTLNYRAVYDHLAKGASDLCTDDFEKLEGGLGLDALPEESATPQHASEPPPFESPYESGTETLADTEPELETGAEPGTQIFRAGQPDPDLDLDATDPGVEAVEAEEQRRF